MSVISAGIIFYGSIKQQYIRHFYDYAQKIEKIKSQILPGQAFTRKNSNHTYRSGSNIKKGCKVDMSFLDKIIRIGDDFIEVEGNTKVTHVVKSLLKQSPPRNIMSVADLSQLTLSGLFCGVGGGASSFKTGYFHNNIKELDLLMSNGEIKTLDRSHELMRALPRSLGSLGYITRMKINTKEVSPYVESRMTHFSDSSKYFSHLRGEINNKNIDFLDGVIFGPKEFVLITGTYLSVLPEGVSLTNVQNDKVYYEEIRKSKLLYFDTFSYIYRYETDLYFTSMSTPKWLKKRWFRRMIPRAFIKPIHRILGAIMPVKIRLFCSDIMIPEKNANSFFHFYEKEVGVYPIYICPCKVPKDKQMALFWPDDQTFIDFGVGYGLLPKDSSKENQTRLLKSIEREMIKQGGCKLPYTDTFLSKRSFEKHFQNYKLYKELRKKYGFVNFKSVYDKRKFK